MKLRHWTICLVAILPLVAAEETRFPSQLLEWSDPAGTSAGDGLKSVSEIDHATVTLDHLEASSGAIAKGARIRRSESEADVVMIVRSGRINLTIAGQSQVLLPADLALIIRGSEYEIANESDGEATFHVVRMVAERTAKNHQTAEKPALATRIYPWAASTARPAKTGEFHAFLSGPTANLRLLDIHGTVLNAGFEPHAPHRHPYEEIVVMQAGTLEVTAAEAKKVLHAGAVMFFASNDLHGWRNIGPDPARYHVIRIESDKTEPSAPPHN